MVSLQSGSWPARGAAFVLWLLAVASAVYWGLRVSAQPAPLSLPPASTRAALPADPAAVARLLGGTAPAPVAGVPQVPALSTRFTLVGVVAGERSGGGAAVISVDGKPARPFRVGSAVDEGLVLQSVQGRRAVLAPQMTGPAALTLELPLRKGAG
jgi:general secretion pathway protein C